MSKNLLAKYYQGNTKRLQRRKRKTVTIWSRRLQISLRR